MKIYLDNCCFNRPFDDQTNFRIRLESEAIKMILFLCEQKHWQLISSKIVEFENMGLQAFAALHLACSENRADVILTVDDKFLKRSLKIQDLKIKVSNPLKWLEEVLL